MTDEERAEWRRVHRERREKMTEKALAIETLERLDGVASLLSTLLAKAAETARAAEDARKISSTALRAVSGPFCEHANEAPHVCPCPPHCYCRGLTCR